jgi:hypothetical protein
MKLNKILFLICLFLNLFAFKVFAFDLPKLPIQLPIYIPGSNNTNSNNSAGEGGIGGLLNQQSSVAQSLNKSLKDLSESQSIMASALGLMEESNIAKSNANNLAKGDLTGKDDIKKAVSSTLEVQKKIDEKMAQGAKLDAASRAKFSSAIPVYTRGTIGIFQTVNQAKNAAMSLAQTRDLTALTQLGSLVYVVSEAPNLLSAFSGATSNITKFASANNIDTSKLKNATASLGE